jgi:23S rRNA pseudouridine2605 synthase
MTRQRRHKSAKTQSQPREAPETPTSERLQKVLASAGVASRRDCEELIREGRVEVDRKVVTELGTRVNPLAQEIRVDGEPLRRPKRVYFALNKPMDIVCTNHDPSGRTRVIDLVPSDERVFAVGRLDRASEGLILLTNDGDFSNHITHPRYGVEKTYLVRVAGRPGPEELAKLRRGVHLAEGFCKVESVVVKSRHKQSSDLLIVLDEGRNREIRRILAKVGHKVVRLKRIAIGDLKLGALEVGEWRKLTQAEIDSLQAISRQKRKEKKKPPARDAAAAAEVAAMEKVRTEASAEKPKKAVAKTVETTSPPPKPKPKPPSAKEIAAKMRAGKDFEDEDDDFEDDDHDFGEEVLSDDFEEDDDDLDDDEDGDDDDDLIGQAVIREEVLDDRSPPQSGPVPRGDVIDFDEDGPPPLQPRKVREAKSAPRAEPRPQTAARPQRNERSQPASRPQRGERPQRTDRPQRTERPPSGDRAERPQRGDRPLRAEPRTSHRRRGDETSGTGQSVRRGQRHRQEEVAGDPRTGRPARPAKGYNPRREKPPEGAVPRGQEPKSKVSMPKRPGKLIVDRPQEDRGARGKYPGKSFGKGKKFEGGSRGPKTIFGKRVKKKGRGQQ